MTDYYVHHRRFFIDSDSRIIPCLFYTATMAIVCDSECMHDGFSDMRLCRTKQVRAGLISRESIDLVKCRQIGTDGRTNPLYPASAMLEYTLFGSRYVRLHRCPIITQSLHYLYLYIFDIFERRPPDGSDHALRHTSISHGIRSYGFISSIYAVHGISFMVYHAYIMPSKICQLESS